MHTKGNYAIIKLQILIIPFPLTSNLSLKSNHTLQRPLTKHIRDCVYEKLPT